MSADERDLPRVDPAAMRRVKIEREIDDLTATIERVEKEIRYLDESARVAREFIKTHNEKRDRLRAELSQ
jgi:predicted RNase H-like nuclease (RuvC/YqgF family)